MRLSTRAGSSRPTSSAEVQLQTEFGAVLVGLGVDLTSAPVGVLGRADQQVCGPERLDQAAISSRWLDEVARRCFLDAHVAGLPAALASVQPTAEGDPIVSVWLTAPDSAAAFVDNTRDAYGSGTWSTLHGCRRFTTVHARTPPARPPTEFYCHTAQSYAPSGQLAVIPDQPGDDVAVDVRPLEPAMRLAGIDANYASLLAAEDGSYPFSLPAEGCFVVSVIWSGDVRGGLWVGLAESTVGACAQQ